MIPLMALNAFEGENITERINITGNNITNEDVTRGIKSR